MLAMEVRDYARKLFVQRGAVAIAEAAQKAADLEKDGQATDQGTVLEADPPRRLAYTWHPQYNEELRREKPSRVTFVIELDFCFVDVRFSVALTMSSPPGVFTGG